MFAPGNINRVINLNAHKDDDDGFWSDDDKNPIQMFAKPKNQSNNNLPEIQQIPELTDNTGPIDKDDELMTAIIQTASKQKTIIGKDEIEYDNFAMKNQQQKFNKFNQISRKLHNNKIRKEKGINIQAKILERKDIVITNLLEKMILLLKYRLLVQIQILISNTQHKYLKHLLNQQYNYHLPNKLNK